MNVSGETLHFDKVCENIQQLFDEIIRRGNSKWSEYKQHFVCIQKKMRVHTQMEYEFLIEFLISFHLMLLSVKDKNLISRVKQQREHLQILHSKLPPWTSGKLYRCQG